jgi:adenylate kinase
MFNLKLTDTDGILPNVMVPVSLYNNEVSEEKLNHIAKDIIAQQTEIQSANIIKPIETMEPEVIIDTNVIVEEPQITQTVEPEVIIDTNVIVEEQPLPVENNSVDNTLLSDSETTENTLNTDIV